MKRLGSILVLHTPITVVFPFIDVLETKGKMDNRSFPLDFSYPPPLPAIEYEGAFESVVTAPVAVPGVMVVAEEGGCERERMGQKAVVRWLVVGIIGWVIAALEGLPNATLSLSPPGSSSWKQEKKFLLARSFQEAPGGTPFSQLHSVEVQCLEKQMTISVQRDLFGTGKLIKPSDLSLGPRDCRHTALRAPEDTVVFEIGLHECGSRLQMTNDRMTYSINLYYNPAPASNPVILRAIPAVILIECSYPRRNNVSSQAIKPTWLPYRSTLSAEGKLDFSLRLMTEDWSAERTSSNFHLGDVLYIQADVNAGNHIPLRLFIEKCVATQTPDEESRPQYAIIDFKGCLVDGQSEESTSAFISPRLKQETLQFTVDAFKFTDDVTNLIYITCHLKITAVDHVPDPSNKACSFNKAGRISGWIPVEGANEICSCCETGKCASPRLKRSNPPHNVMPVNKTEAVVTLGPLFFGDIASSPSPFADQLELTTPLQDAEQLPILLLLLGLGLGAIMFLTLITVGILLGLKRYRRSLTA
ncbi:LOW QUALITY PROTEIN: zona pellucida sperm-binding protein 3-like [Tachyglossus aculeatus]|uniref:LOW QUALITY PROTEIN: zona pellucida sperm-binding protein 3-like n=1 Tax=Tachyglossus aculeatus TaxID=9261 RepID=UPI0018F43F21|nr:LOW QUALITY PROTEIN: zona pellucida sperm-binding protein 3-like [Tachyglossus aculeatus]